MERRAHIRPIAACAVTVAWMLLAALPQSALANTVLGTTGCTSSAARSVPAPSPGTSAMSTEDCTISFGSADAAAMVHVYQSDRGGSALHRPSIGVLDTAFSGDGQLQDDHSAGADEYRGVAIQPDGRIVVVGVHGATTDMYVRRYLPDGTLDTGFAVGGEVMLSGTWETRDLELAPDGSIFVVGYGSNRVQVAKLTPTGAFDPTWNGGTWTNHFFSSAGGSGINAETIAIGRGGEVYIGGYTDLLGENDFAILNYTADGRLDPTFDGDGVRIVDIGGVDEGRAILEQADGRIVLAGLATNATIDAAVVRLLPDGQLDPTFDGDGIRSIAVGTGSDYVRGLVQRPTGELVIVGNRRNGEHDPYALQLLANGATDTSWGTSGVAVVPISGADETVLDARLQPDGAVVFAGRRETADMSLLFGRVTAAGAPDTSFGSNGIRLHEGGNVLEELRGMAVGVDGRIAAVGYSADAGQEHAKLVVLRSDSVADVGGGANFTPGGDAFGACLRSVGGGATTSATTWTADATCTLGAGSWWRGIPTSMGASSKVASTTGAGVVDATASLRFGLELDGSEPPGAYVAPITVDVIAPNLEPPASTGAPTVSGMAQVKQQLTATTGSWSGSATITYGWQWQRCTPGCVDIADATASTYRPVTADVGATLRVVVTATNSIGTATANSAQTAVVTDAPTLSAFYSTGFEHRTTSTAGGGIYDVAAGAGAVSIDTTTKRSGAASLRFVGGGSYREWDVNVPQQNTHRMGAARFYFRAAANPSATRTIAEFEASGSLFCEVVLSTTGQLIGRITSGTSTNQNGPTTTPGRWYRVDFDCDTRGATTQMRWSVDGVPQTTVTRATAAAFVNVFQLGIDSTSNLDINFDDVIATTDIADYPIGPGRAVALLPSGTGAHNTHANFRSSTDDGATWPVVGVGDDNQLPGTAGLLDDWPVTTGASADLVRAAATGGHLEYAFGDLANGDPVNAISMLVAERSGPGSGRVDIAADGGAGFQSILSNQPNTTVEYRRATLAGVPTSGARWSSTSANALRVRFSSSDVTDMPRMDAILAEADVASPDPPTNLAVPIVSGVARVGATLTTSNGSWTPLGGLSYAYQWQSCNPSCTDISGATSASYTPVVGDVGRALRVIVLASNAGGTTSATSAQTVLVASASPTLTSLDGFEIGDVSTNGNLYDSMTTAAGTVSASSTWARTGRHSLRIDNVGGGGDTMLAYPTAGAVGVLRVSLRLENLIASGGMRELLEFRASDAANCEIGYNASTGRIYATIAGTTQVGPVIDAGRWYDIDIRCDMSSGTRRIDWALDGARQTPVTRAQAAGSIVRVSLGNTGGGTAPYTVNVDDVALSATSSDYPLGNVAVEPLAPTQAGTHNTVASFDTTTNGGSTWTAVAPEDNAQPGTSQHVDEYPYVFTAGTSGDLIRQTSTTGYLEFQLADSDRVEAPLSVRGIGTHTTPDSTGSQEPQLTGAIGANTTLLYMADLTGVPYTMWTRAGIMNVQPSGAAWTASAIDSLRLRLGANSVGAATTRPWTLNVLAEAAFPTRSGPAAVAAPQVQQPYQSLKVGDELAVDDATWDESVTSRTWQWLRCPTSSTCTPISGATGPTYVLAAGDAGSTIRVAETAATSGGRQSVLSTMTDYVATQPTIAFMTGFEAGALTTSTDGASTVGTPTFGSATVRSGARALAATAAATDDAMRYQLAPGQQAAVTRVYVRVDDASPDTTQSLLAIETSGPTRSCDVDFHPGGAVSATLYDGTDRDPQYPGLSLQANRWYLLEMRLSTSATTWQCDWSVDGVRQPASIWNFGATDTIDWVGAGARGDVDDVTYHDDWMVSTTASDFPLGPGRTVALQVDGEGTHATAGSFGSNAGALGAAPGLRVDELAGWGIADWVEQTVSGTSSYLEWTLANPTERSATARAVRGVVGYHAASALGNDGQTKVVRAGDTDAAAPTVQSGNMSTTTLGWTGALVPPPASGWTPSALDQLRMRTGYASDVSPAPRWEAVVVEVEYRE